MSQKPFNPVVAGPAPKSSINIALTDDRRAIVLSYMLHAPPAGAVEAVIVLPGIEQARQVGAAILKACEEAGRVVLATPGEVPPMPKA